MNWYFLIHLLFLGLLVAAVAALVLIGLAYDHE